jgi:hypothetical protein
MLASQASHTVTSPCNLTDFYEQHGVPASLTIWRRYTLFGFAFGLHGSLTSLALRSFPPTGRPWEYRNISVTEPWMPAVPEWVSVGDWESDSRHNDILTLKGRSRHCRCLRLNIFCKFLSLSRFEYLLRNQSRVTSTLESGTVRIARCLGPERGMGRTELQCSWNPLPTSTLIRLMFHRAR